MNEKNILSLKTRLVQLGFEPSVDTLLRCNICFSVPAFDLAVERKVGIDFFHFGVHLERSDKDLYELKYYTATLRKQVIVPAELESLNQSMQSVDWNALVAGKISPVNIDNDSVQTAFNVLHELEVAVGGAELLKYKHWNGSFLEPLIQQLAVLKNEWEISERFYFFDDSVVITFEDAMRFLSSKWMEKQMIIRKKLLVKKAVGDRTGGSVAGGKLLAKNPRRLSRRSIDKTS